MASTARVQRRYMYLYSAYYSFIDLYSSPQSNRRFFCLRHLIHSYHRLNFDHFCYSVTGKRFVWDVKSHKVQVDVVPTQHKREATCHWRGKQTSQSLYISFLGS